MKFLVVDPMMVSGFSLATRLASGGHEVVYSPIVGPNLDHPFYLAMGRGLEAHGLKVDLDWYKHLDADAAIVLGAEHGGGLVEFISKHCPTLGPTPSAAVLEMDRAAGQAAARKAGLVIPKTKTFDAYEDAARYVAGVGDRVVVKFDGLRKLGETMVSKAPGNQDAVEAIRSARSKMSGIPVKIHVVEFVPGVEVDVGGFFDGERFSDLFLSFDGEYGFMFAFDVPQRNKLFEQVRAFEPILAKTGMRGPVDINGCLLDGEFHFFEFTCRWGYGVTNIFAQAIGNFGAYLKALADGKPIPMVLRDAIRNGGAHTGIAVNVMLPDSQEIQEIHSEMEWPYLRKEAGFWPEYMTQVGDQDYVVPAPHHAKYVAHYTALGSSLSNAIAKAEAMSKAASFRGATAMFAEFKAEMKDKERLIFDAFRAH